MNAILLVLFFNLKKNECMNETI